MLTSSRTTIGYWKAEKICTPSLLSEEVHPCDSNPLLTSPGGGSEWSNRAPLPHGTVRRKLSCRLDFTSEKLLTVSLEANTVPEGHNSLCKVPTFLAFWGPIPSDFMKFRLLSSFQKTELHLILYYYELWLYFATNLPAGLPLGFYSEIEELFKTASEVYFNFEMW